MSDSKFRVLYVCPFAHYPGHFSEAAHKECAALKQAGVDVSLLTFEGTLGGPRQDIAHRKVRENLRLSKPLVYLAGGLRKSNVTRPLAMLIENCLVLSFAVRKKSREGHDVIHLRDGDPYLFLVHLFGVFCKQVNWVVTLTGCTLSSISHTAVPRKKKFGLSFYQLTLSLVNSKLWMPIFRRSLSRNKFVHITHSDTLVDNFDTYVGGVLCGKIQSIPLGVPPKVETPSRAEARSRLGLAEGQRVLLSFGVAHKGKSLETVLRALVNVKEVCLFCVGDAHLMGSPTPATLIDRYNLGDRVILRNEYIPEADKALYFSAADALVLSYTRSFDSVSSMLWEACRFKIPVIASDNSDLGLEVDKYTLGITFPAEDSTLLAKTIQQFFEFDRARISSIRQNFSLFADEFSEERWCRGVLAAYSSLSDIAPNRSNHSSAIS